MALEERNITLSLEKAREFYSKGGELKDLALSAFTEDEILIIYHYQYGYGVIQTIVESTVKVLIKGNIHYFDKADLVMCDTRYIDIL